MTRLRRTGNERGITTVELIVAVALMVMVVPVLGPVMVGSLQMANEIEVDTRTTDELRVQILSIGREIRSSTCITAPVEGTSGSVLQIKTRAGTGGEYEVRYKVADQDSDGVLDLVRTKNPAAVSPVHQIIGTGLVEPDSTFTYVSTPRKSVTVRLLVDLESDDGPTELRTTFAGRNAWDAAC